MAPRTKTQTTILGAISLNAQALESTRLTLDHLIVRAHKSKIPQATIAEAAGVSQAHVSRTLAAARTADEERKASRRSRRNREGGTV